MEVEGVIRQKYFSIIHQHVAILEVVAVEEVEEYLNNTFSF
jgi:hypothetical protein